MSRVASWIAAGVVCCLVVGTAPDRAAATASDGSGPLHRWPSAPIDDGVAPDAGFGFDPTLEAAMFALDLETAVLVELGGFGDDVPTALAALHESWVEITEQFGPPLTTAELVLLLNDADADGAARLGELVARGDAPSPEVRTALGRLDEAQIAAVRDGRPIGIAPVVYVRAIEHLITNGGAAPAAAQDPSPADPAPTIPPTDVRAAGTTPIDEPRVTGSTPPNGSKGALGDTPSLDGTSPDDAGAAGATGQDASTAERSEASVDESAASGGAAEGSDPAAGAGEQTSSASQSEPSSADGGPPLALVVAAAAAAVAGGVVLLVVRRRRGAVRPSSARAGSPLPPPPPAVSAPTPVAEAGPTDRFDQMIDVSRRMTNAGSAAEVARIATADALSLVGARLGAFVDVGVGGLAVAHTVGDFLDRRRLGDGVLARVADTGQSVRQVSHDEPAVTALPVSLLAVPIVVGGRVVAIVVLVREDTAPFDASDEDDLIRLAPMVGSALASAGKLTSAEALSRIDQLTGLPNRRSLDEELASALPAGPGSASGVVMVDVDYFKQYNDTHGHAAGDEALRRVGSALRSAVREHDRAFRYGGEEFALVLRGVTRDEAAAVAERVRATVEATDVHGEESLPHGRLTVSIGVALVTGEDPAAAIELADRALYDAKHGGRNRVVLVDGAAPVPA